MSPPATSSSADVSFHFLLQALCISLQLGSPVLPRLSQSVPILTRNSTGTFLLHGCPSPGFGLVLAYYGAAKQDAPAPLPAGKPVPSSARSDELQLH